MRTASARPRAAALAHADADKLAAWYTHMRQPPGPASFQRLRRLLDQARWAYRNGRGRSVSFRWGDAKFTATCTAYGAMVVRCATTGRTICTGGATWA